MKHQHRIIGNHLQKPKLIKVAVTVLVILSSHAHANSEKLVNPANNHAYQRLDSALDWNTAKTVCSNMGAHLATITSQAENDWIYNNAVNGNRVWLGGTDEVHEGTWNWITNETWSYTNWWTPVQPDNNGGAENYLEMYSSVDSVWNDNPSSETKAYLCEWEPDTTINVYNNDFSTSAGAEWTYPTIATSNGEKFLGANAYGFGAGSNTLTLNNLPAHTKVMVDFDLYTILSWDGNSSSLNGPDNWQLTADGTNLLLTNFTNCNTNQAYPNQLSPYGPGGSFSKTIGAFELGHLASQYSWSSICSPGDSTYRLSYTFAHTSTSIALKFTSMQTGPSTEEGWGLDNVRVSVNTQSPLVTTLPVTNITDTSANLNAQVNSNGSDAIVGFNFGPTTTYGTNVAAVPDVVSGSSAVTGTATGLTCNTIYHYRIEATNSFGTNYGADQSFTTGVCPVPPTAITNDATGVNATAAILNGSINPNGIAVTAVSFDYGSTTAYGASVNANPNTINAGFNPVNVSAVKGGFTCNTTYHYRLTATNDYGTGYGADKTFTTTPANCQTAPVVVTTAPTLITVASATLNGQVTSNPVTTAVSFDFGRTTAYGSSVAAIPDKVYSATPVAISAVKTGLSCATEYHYRATAVNSIGTGLGLDQSFTTETCPQAVNAWLAPSTLTKIRDQVFTLDVIANSNSVKLGSYMFVVTLDTTKLVLDTTYQNASSTCSKGVCPGSNAVANRATIVNAAGNTITLTGDDSTGVAPGNDLQLLVMHLKTKLTTGATPVTLTTSALDATSGETIGLAARGATVNVSYGYCGDSDGNTRVNIIDALAIARKLVGLPPPPTIDDLLADTNKNARVDINDALFIARYAVGLVIPPEVCNIGQPL